MNAIRVLTLNSGSSSLKFSVYECTPTSEKCLLQGKLERIGKTDSRFHMVDGERAELKDESITLPNHEKALELLLAQLRIFEPGHIDAIGHRIVQGGPHHMGPERVTPELLKELRALCPLDPPHLPAALQAIEAAEKLGSNIPQVACFDTSFHRTLPHVAQLLPIPWQFSEEGALIRYGFHGLSYEFISGELVRIAGDKTAKGKVIIAHLGNGASMAALRDGKSIETTMGFTPAAGLVMGSRSGDLDPGVISYLLREKKLRPEALDEFIYQQCGLKGVSGSSSDLRDLIAAQASDPHARDAVELFCYQARKFLGSLAAVLDGVETIVFTGGIGENAASTRASICEGLTYLGLEIDPAANDLNQDVISSPGSRATVRVMKTNEELVIARHTARLVLVRSKSSTSNTTS